MDPLATALAVVQATQPDYESVKAAALMIGYDRKWRDKYPQFEIVEVESEFRFSLLNPETEGTSKTFDECGKIDAVLRHRDTGRYIVLEHKTTADPIDGGSDYWDRLAMDTQCSKYILAQRAIGREVGNLLYDVIHKPGSRPRQIPTLDTDGVKIVLDASGTRVRTLNGKKWRESGDAAAGYVLQTVIETPAEYGARLAIEIAEEPDRYFAQREVARLDSDLLEYMGDAWALSQQILGYRRAKLWPRNPAACDAFGRCEFFDLCAGRASVDGIRFREGKAHRELADQRVCKICDGGPGNECACSCGHKAYEALKEPLTNSRLTALRKCSRYHYLRYESPTEPCREESEALRFGTLLHKMFEAYFTAIKSNQ